MQIFQHDGRVNGAMFDSNESRVLSWSEDKTARLWDLDVASLLARSRTLAGRELTDTERKKFLLDSR